MKEEFNIEIKEIELLTTFTLDGEFAGSYTIFTSKLASPISQVQCNEGQKAEFFSPQDVLKIGLPKIATRILKKYLARIEAYIWANQKGKIENSLYYQVFFVYRR